MMTPASSSPSNVGFSSLVSGDGAGATTAAASGNAGPAGGGGGGGTDDI